MKTRSELIRFLAKKTKLKQSVVRKVHDALVEHIIEQVSNDQDVFLMNLGRFTQRPMGYKGPGNTKVAVAERGYRKIKIFFAPSLDLNRKLNIINDQKRVELAENQADPGVNPPD